MLNTSRLLLRSPLSAPCICTKATALPLCMRYASSISNQPAQPKFKQSQYKPRVTQGTHFLKRGESTTIDITNSSLQNFDVSATVKEPKFLKYLSNRDLSTYVLLSIFTANGFLIKIATKALAMMPTFLVKALVYPIYCGGENYKEVVETGKRLLNRGFQNMMISYTVEDAEGESSSRTLKLIEDAPQRIIESIDNILVPHNMNLAKKYPDAKDLSPGYVALKPTGMMVGATDILRNFKNPEYKERWNNYVELNAKICQHAKDQSIKTGTRIIIVLDAEKRDLQEGVYELQRELMKRFNVDGHNIVVGTIQMYLQDSLKQLNDEIKLSKESYSKYTVSMKLVRGAYIHSEPNREKVIHLTKEDTDKSYNDGIALAINEINNGNFGHLVVASHNNDSLQMASNRLEVIKSSGNFNKNFESDVVFGQLMGMAEDEGSQLANDQGRKVIKYVPWGPVRETKEYLVRRMEENGDAIRSENGWKMVGYCLKELGSRVFSKSS